MVISTTRRRGAEVTEFEYADGTFAVVSVPHAAPAGALTDAEREVAALIADGRSNAEIARARGTSRNTVSNQIASILRKLGVGSRVEVAARIRGERR